MIKLLKRLLTCKKELPEGYVMKNPVWGTEIACSHSGTICWIPGMVIDDGTKVPGFWKEIDDFFIVEKNGKIRKMNQNEIKCWEKHFRER